MIEEGEIRKGGCEGIILCLANQRKAEAFARIFVHAGIFRGFSEKRAGEAAMVGGGGGGGGPPPHPKI